MAVRPVPGLETIEPMRPCEPRQNNNDVAVWLNYLAGQVRRGELGEVLYGSVMLVRGDSTMLRVFKASDPS